jgi:hypothetical protein
MSIETRFDIPLIAAMALKEKQFHQNYRIVNDKGLSMSRTLRPYFRPVAKTRKSVAPERNRGLAVPRYLGVRKREMKVP